MIDDRNLSRVCLSDVQIMSRQYRRHTSCRLSTNPVLDRDASLRIQGCQRLLQHQNLKIVQTRSDQRHFLLHPFRQGSNQTVPFLLQAEALERLGNLPVEKIIWDSSDLPNKL